MKKLQLEDIILKHKCEIPLFETHFLDFNISDSTIFPQIFSKKIELTQKYQQQDSNILDSFIDTLLKSYNKESDLLLNNLNNFSYDQENQRRIITRIYMMSNQIAKSSRIGPADSIIVDNHRYLFNYLKINEQLSLKTFYHNGLGDKIIVFKKTTKEQPHWGLFHDDSLYSLSEVGVYSNFFNIFKLEDVNQSRTKKLQRILNENFNQ